MICIATYGKHWEEVEEKWPHLRNKPRNATISLEMDGINTFGDKIYYVWPDFIIKNNLPPWMKMKNEHAM